MYADIYYNILSNCDIRTLYRAQSVSKKFHDLSVQVLDQTDNKSYELFLNTMGSLEGSHVQIQTAEFDLMEYESLFANGKYNSILIHRKRQFVCVRSNKITYIHNSPFMIDYVINFIIQKLFEHNDRNTMSIQEYRSKFDVDVKYQFKFNAKYSYWLRNETVNNLVQKIKRTTKIPVETDTINIKCQNKIVSFCHDNDITFYSQKKKIGKYEYDNKLFNNAHGLRSICLMAQIGYMISAYSFNRHHLT